MRVLVLAMVLSLPVSATDFDPNRVTWQRIDLEASILFWDLEASIHWEPDAVLPEKLPILPGKTPLTMKKPYKMTLNTNLRGTDGEVFSWFDPRDGRVILGKKLNRGKKNYRKWYRYMKDEVVIQRLGPARRSENQSMERWSKVEQFRYQWPFARDQRPLISDTTALFFLLAASDLDGKDESFELHCWAGKDLLLVQPTVIGQKTMTVEFAENGGPKKKQAVEVLEIRLDTSHLGSIKGKSSFSLLGLKEDIVINLGLKNRVPISINGKAPLAGNTSIKLVRVKGRDAVGSEQSPG